MKVGRLMSDAFSQAIDFAGYSTLKPMINNHAGSGSLLAGFPCAWTPPPPSFSQPPTPTV